MREAQKLNEYKRSRPHPRNTTRVARVLREAGLCFDSSIFPMGSHPGHGMGDALLENFTLGEEVIGIPMSCARAGPWRISCSGGGYFRPFPYATTRGIVRKSGEVG